MILTRKHRAIREYRQATPSKRKQIDSFNKAAVEAVRRENRKLIRLSNDPGYYFRSIK